MMQGFDVVFTVETFGVVEHAREHPVGVGGAVGVVVGLGEDMEVKIVPRCPRPRVWYIRGRFSSKRSTASSSRSVRSRSTPRLCR